MAQTQQDWRREWLKVVKKQRSRGRLLLYDGSCIRLRPESRNHVWSYDFVEAQTHDGRKLRLMTLIDEFTREYRRSVLRAGSIASVSSTQ